jgi:hypothetical protein
MFELVNNEYNIVLYNDYDNYDNISLLKHKYNFTRKNSNQFIDDYKNNYCVKYIILSHLPEVIHNLKGDFSKLILCPHSHDEMSLIKKHISPQYFLLSDVLSDNNNDKLIVPFVNRPMINLNQVSSNTPVINNTIHIVKIGWVFLDSDNFYEKILSTKNVKLTIFCRIPTMDLQKLQHKYKNIDIQLSKTTKYIYDYIFDNNIKFLLHVSKDDIWSGSIPMALDNHLILITDTKTISKNNIPKEYCISYNDNNFESLLFRNNIRDLRDVKILQQYRNKIFIENHKKLHTILNNKFEIVFNNKIIKSNSESYQDFFVAIANRIKKNGFFIEIGSAWPNHINNTYLLEKEFNWKGIMIEYDKRYLDSYKEIRPNSIHVIQDATKIDYVKLFDDNNVPLNIDYLQIDLNVEDESTLNTLKLFDKYIFDKYKFATITIEHDFYRGDYFNTRYISRQILHKRGYILLFPDISIGIGNVYKPYEDWWVHPDLADPDFIKKHYNSNIKPIVTSQIFYHNHNII